MLPMTTSDPGEVRQPGEVRDSRGDGAGRRLERAPSARYASPDRADVAQGSIIGPLAQAAVVALAGAALLFLVGAVVASTVGLAFVCGVTGAGIGLVLAQLGVGREGAPPRLSRTRTLWLAIGMAIGGVIAADVATWLYALREGGTLGLVDYLFETFGPFVPGELVVAALGAVWGASSGPITRS
jgi:hypothetical protein